MRDFFEDLHGDQDDDASEPSFTLYEFKKWLSKQKKAKSSEDVRKEELKEKFKERFKNKMRKKD